MDTRQLETVIGDEVMRACCRKVKAIQVTKKRHHLDFLSICLLSRSSSVLRE